jgi:hypothetical protein
MRVYDHFNFWLQSIHPDHKILSVECPSLCLITFVSVLHDPMLNLGRHHWCGTTSMQVKFCQMPLSQQDRSREAEVRLKFGFLLSILNRNSQLKS